MKNITELRNEIGKTFEGLRDGKLDIKVGGEMNNSAGKMINTIKVQLEYNKFLKDRKNIPFLQDKDCVSNLITKNNK